MYPLREGVYHGYTPLVIILKCTQVGYIIIYTRYPYDTPNHQMIGAKKEEDKKERTNLELFGATLSQDGVLAVLSAPEAME